MMRSHGVRLANAAKNTGVRRFAFSNFHIEYVLDEAYVPPPGTTTSNPDLT